MSEPIVPVVLAGGQGKRLWPMSRAARPKQFLPLTGQASLYQQALLRPCRARGYTPAIVITNERYRFLAAEQVLEADANVAAILLEPEGRNTALAIAVAARFAMAQFGENCILHILPADHDVGAVPDYEAAVNRAIKAANTGLLVTFGATPTAPETGYGYIQPGPALSEGVQCVERFIEKPEREHAEAMIAAGGHLWNTGMFMFRAETFLDECNALAPKTHLAAIGAMEGATRDLDFIRLAASPFRDAPDISVDYAILEKTNRAAVIPVSFPWSDLGTWDKVWTAGSKDDAGNVSNGAVTLSNVSNTLVISEKAHVAVEGLHDIVVVASEDAIFIGKLCEAQKVGLLVKTLSDRPETCSLTDTHPTRYVPWGGHSAVLGGHRFQVKRIWVKPGRQLSLQRHYHRSEHWIVVRGTAQVTLDGTVQTLSENESVYIPLGTVHRLSNPGKITLELIEVQTGSYLGEDDIVRLEDDFGRI